MSQRTTICGILTLILLPLLALTAPGAQADPTTTQVEEHWSLVYLIGNESPLGAVSEKIYREKRDGRDVFRTQTSMKMRMLRLDEALEINIDSEQVEDARTGTLLYLTQKQLMSSQETAYEGSLQDGKLEVSISHYGRTQKQTVPWSADILGPVAQARMHAEALLHGTKEFSCKTFTFDFMRVTTVKVWILDKETISVGDKKMDLTRVESEVDALAGVRMQSWVNEEGEAVKTVVPYIGNMQFLRVDKNEAMEFLDSNSSSAPELLIGLSAPSDRSIPDPYRTNEALYEIKLTEMDGATLDPKDFEADNHDVTVLGSRRVQLRVRSLIPDPMAELRIPVEDSSLGEYLSSNLYIESDDREIITAARKVIGTETSLWLAAKKLEEWVRGSITTKSLAMGFSSAKEVLDTREGDCTEHAVLLAALCRAVGIPARVAVGLLYYEDRSSPHPWNFVGHMWTEVNAGGRWCPLDATIAHPWVDASRIRFDASSLQSTSIGDAFLSLSRLIGNVSIDVLEYSHGTKVWKRKPGPEGIIEGDKWASSSLGIQVRKPKGWAFVSPTEAGSSAVLITLSPPDGENHGRIVLSSQVARTKAAQETILTHQELGGYKVRERKENQVNGQRRVRLELERKTLLLFKSRRIKWFVFEGDQAYVLSMLVESDSDPVLLDEVAKSLEVAPRGSSE